MKNQILPLLLLVTLIVSSCKKETIANRDNLILGKWDCVDYADSLTNELKWVPPVFISNLYEIGYEFSKEGFMLTRNKGGDNKITTNKSVDCEWTLSKDKLSLSLFFPDNFVETYEIIEMTRKKLIIKGVEGFWAGTESTYVFEKK